MRLNCLKQFIAILFSGVLCTCVPDRLQSILKTLEDYQYPLSDSLIAEMNGLYGKVVKAHDYPAMEKIVVTLVRHYNNMNDHKPAFLLLNDYLDNVKASGDSALIPAALYLTGVVYFNCGLPYYSIDYFLKMNDYPMDDRRRSRAYYAIAENARTLTMNNAIDALEYYKKSEAIARNTNDLAMLSYTLFGQSQMLFESTEAYKDLNWSEGMRDSLVQSTRLLEESIASYNNANDPVFIIALSLNYAAMGMYDKALSYRDSIESFRSIPKYTSITLNCMAAMGHYMQEFDEVIRLGRESYDIAVRNNRTFDTRNAANILAYAYKAKGDYKNALLNLEIVRKVEDELKKNEGDMEVLALQVKYELKVKEQLIARQHAQLLWSIAITGLIVAALLVIAYFYRKTKVAYHELVLKSQQWAGIDIVEKEDNTIESSLSPSAATTPGLMDKLIMEEIQKQIAEGIYKNPDLTLDLFAKKIDSNPSYVSNAINRCTGKNFKTYINEYRVKEAIYILSDEYSEDISIDELAENAGFNDRKNFYRVFKKITGLSPTNFKNNRIRKQPFDSK